MAARSWSFMSWKLNHGMIWRRLPSNGGGTQPVLRTPTGQVGWWVSRSAPVLMTRTNSANVRPPSGSPLLSGVKFRVIMSAEPGTNGPKFLPPPMYVAGDIFADVGRVLFSPPEPESVYTSRSESRLPPFAFFLK